MLTTFGRRNRRGAPRGLPKDNLVPERECRTHRLLLPGALLGWWGCVLMQTVFLHRYASHGMFRLSKGWERTFYFFTYVFQGSASLVSRAKGAHHAYSDTEKDPHPPLRFGNVFQNNHHRRGQSANFAQGPFLRTRALFGTATGQLAGEEAQGSPRVPSPVAEPTGAL